MRSEMSRSFVKAWATVATIIALTCFAFVEPMPEGTSSARAPAAAKAAAVTGSTAGDQLSPAVPFVDSLVTGKPLTPLLTVERQVLSHHADGRLLAQARGPTAPAQTAPEPPTRPG